MSNNKTNAERKVGYKNPPKNTQFKKGQSGNPKGRPKKSLKQGIAQEDLIKMILDDAKEPVTITANGKTQEMSSLAAMIKAMKLQAIAGKKGAAKEYLRLVQEAQEKHQEIFENNMQAVMNLAKDIDTLDNDAFYDKHLMVKSDALPLLDVLFDLTNKN